MSDRATRKFAYLVALPAPAPATRCALSSVPCLPRGALESWWIERAELSKAVRDVQARAWRVRRGASRETCRALRTELATLSQRIGSVSARWRTIYALVAAAGSALRVRGLWLPHWQTLATAAVYEFALARDDAPRRGAAPIAEHCEPSLVLESAALGALECACAQQIATLATELDGARAAPEALRVLGTARAECDRVLVAVLPLHFAARNGRESPLLSEHYFRRTLGALLDAQANHCRALVARAARPPNAPLAAHFLESAARHLRTARRAAHTAEPDLDALARHRHGACALALAQAFDAHYRADPSAPLDVRYAADVDNERAPGHAPLIEALACARVARLLLADVAPVARFFDALVERARTMHQVFVPHAQLDLRDAGAQLAARRSVRFVSAPTSGIARARVVCTHRAPLGAACSLDEPRAYQLCVPHSTAN